MAFRTGNHKQQVIFIGGLTDGLFACECVLQHSISSLAFACLVFVQSMKILVCIWLHHNFHLFPSCLARRDVLKWEAMSNELLTIQYEIVNYISFLRVILEALAEAITFSGILRLQLH